MSEFKIFIYFVYHFPTKHQWSSGRIVPCHGTDPGSIPGWCNFTFLSFFVFLSNVVSLDLERQKKKKKPGFEYLHFMYEWVI